MSADSYRVDPDDPRAPPQEVWERLTPEERAHVVDSLPSEFLVSEAHPPEGDSHFDAKVRVREVLGGFFSRIGRKVYLACELPVYYPGERMFAPDVLAVMDVEPHSRMRWVVGVEGKGLDGPWRFMSRASGARTWSATWSASRGWASASTSSSTGDG